MSNEGKPDKEVSFRPSNSVPFFTPTLRLCLRMYPEDRRNDPS